MTTPFTILLALLLVFLTSYCCYCYHEELQDADQFSSSWPLYTNSRWIVDGGGRRVKLACVNWPSHLETMLAEGLGKQPLDAISKKIVSMGFNCVRFTWPLFMATNDTLANLTVRQNFESLGGGLAASIAGIGVNNPTFLDLPIITAYQAVVSNLGDNKIMVILDNHISKPGWCCSNTDGNGFFGDQYFDPELWIKGLTKMATLFNGSANVIGMSLRNELRGPRQNAADWYKYMTRGAEAVHSVNPNVLVILSGLSFDNDLAFLNSKQVSLTFSKKLVFELHWYSFSDGSAWLDGNHNQVCGRIMGNVMMRAGFLLGKGWPLFLSEFGIDQRGGNVGDNRYMSCALGVAADLDLDWALWTLQGSYYLRQGILDLEEVYGMLSLDWSTIRNVTYLQRIAAIQTPFQGPGISQHPPYKILFHPATGMCLLRTCLLQPPTLGPCKQSEAWNYTAQQTIILKDTSFCMQAIGIGKPAMISMLCNGSDAKWGLISDSKMHLSANLPGGNGTAVCLDIGVNRTIVTNPCKCLSGNKSCDADSQWFKIVTSTRNVISKNSLPSLQVPRNLDERFSF